MNLTLEIIKLTRGGSERVVCVYNWRGLDYYFFPNLCEMVEFFDEGKEPEHVFASEREMGGFLRFSEEVKVFRILVVIKNHDLTGRMLSDNDAVVID